MTLTNERKRDVLVHFDEKTNEVVFYSVSSESLNDIKSENFDGARISIDTFKEQTAEEAEKDLGAIVFGLLDTFTENPIKIRDYKAINEESKREYVIALEKEAQLGSAEAMFYLSTEYFGIARNSKSFEYLEKSEELLIRSSSLGFTKATERLEEHWDLIKSATLRSIRREKNTNG